MYKKRKQKRNYTHFLSGSDSVLLRFGFVMPCEVEFGLIKDDFARFGFGLICGVWVWFELVVYEGFVLDSKIGDIGIWL